MAQLSRAGFHGVLQTWGQHGDGLATPFYLDMGFSPETIGLVAKGVSLWAVIVGSVLGAFIVVRIGINRSLWVFGVVQMVTILGFVVLAQAGADPWVLGIVIAGEYIGVGLGTSASVAFIARETSRLAVATQFALFTALASLPRVVASSFSGLLVDNIGWIDFFISARCSPYQACCCCFGSLRLMLVRRHGSIEG